MTEVYFQGNAPTLGFDDFGGVSPSAEIYYNAGTSGWSGSFGSLPLVDVNPISISTPGIQNGQFGFTFGGTNGEVFIVEATTNLTSANWKPIQTNTISGTSFNFSNPQWKSYPVRFYRVLLP